MLEDPLKSEKPPEVDLLMAGLFLFCFFVCMELFLITRPGQNMFGAQKPQNSPSAAEAMLFQDVSRIRIRVFHFSLKRPPGVAGF